MFRRAKLEYSLHEEVRRKMAEEQEERLKRAHEQQAELQKKRDVARAERSVLLSVLL
jgi:hypothetical protein